MRHEARERGRGGEELSETTPGSARTRRRRRRRAEREREGRYTIIGRNEVYRRRQRWRKTGGLKQDIIGGGGAGGTIHRPAPGGGFNPLARVGRPCRFPAASLALLSFLTSFCVCLSFAFFPLPRFFWCACLSPPFFSFSPCAPVLAEDGVVLDKNSNHRLDLEQVLHVSQGHEGRTFWPAEQRGESLLLRGGGSWKGCVCWLIFRRRRRQRTAG